MNEIELLQKQVTRLRAELDEKEDRIFELEEALKPDIPCPISMKISPGQWLVLELLLKRPVVTTDAFLIVHGGDVKDRLLKANIHVLRKKLAPYAVTIHHSKGFGYYISNEDKKKLRQIITDLNEREAA